MALGGPNIYPSVGVWLSVSRKLTDKNASEAVPEPEAEQDPAEG